MVERNFSSFGSENKPETPDNNFEEQIRAIEIVVKELGFNENEEARKARLELESSKQFDRELYTKWRDLVEAEIDQLADRQRQINAQIGLNIVEALLWLKIGETEAFRDALDQVVMHAEEDGQDELAEKIRQLNGLI